MPPEHLVGVRWNFEPRITRIKIRILSASSAAQTVKGERMRWRLLCLAAFFFVIAAPAAAQPRDERLWQRALQIHRRAIVIDTHNDVTTPMTNDDFDLSG